MIGTGAAIGFPPAEVKAMSAWEFREAAIGWVNANTPEVPGAMTDAERDLAWEAVQAKMGRVN